MSLQWLIIHVGRGGASCKATDLLQITLAEGSIRAVRSSGIITTVDKPVRVFSVVLTADGLVLMAVFDI